MKRTESARLVTKPEAARRTGVGLRQIRLACKRGEFAEYLIGSWPRVAWNDVLAWLERSRMTEHAANAEPRVRDSQREHEP